MEQSEIIEGNSAIMEFMGYKLAGDGIGRPFNITKPGESDWYLASWSVEGFHQYLVDEIKYHSSWDWLMPVVEKIESMGHKTIIGGGDFWGNYCNILHSNGSLDKAMGQGETKIEAVYKSIVEFILWYNSQSIPTQPLK